MKLHSGDLLQAVREVASLAGAVALRHFNTRLTVETKSDGSPVTIADREAERAARDWIDARFPADGVLGEELGETTPSAKRRWLLDPIDGTKTFVRGVPLWGTLVAVVEGGEVLAGAAVFPALSETLAAARGEGCWWNDARCSVSAVSVLADATVLTTDERFPHSESQRDRWRSLADAAAVSRSWGDCYGYLLVATGRAEAMVDGRLSDWDAACLQPIIEEAGGVFTDWKGVRTPFGRSAIATNAALDSAVRDILVGERAGQQRRG
ncbi:MAG: histidinol-phosphatase [Gemmatimonadota bacterium]|nr:histidinol-phosphatase [Gemmatimonadota bacterium]